MLPTGGVMKNALKIIIILIICPLFVFGGIPIIEVF